MTITTPTGSTGKLFDRNSTLYLHATVDHGRWIAERMDELAGEPSSVRPIRCRARARR